MYDTFAGICLQLESRLRYTVVKEDNARASDTFRHKLEGITSSSYKRNGRTDEAIEGDILVGTIAEMGIANLLKTEVVDERWDIKDRTTFASDVNYAGLRIEVKSHKHMRMFPVSKHSFATMLNNCRDKLIDVVIFAQVERTHTEGWWGVTPTLIVDPYPKVIEFAKLWDEGDYSMVYRADLAAPRDLCHPLIDLEA